MIAAPASVGLIVRPERVTRAAPISFSRVWMRFATAAAVKLSRRAASAIEPLSTASTKDSRNLVSIANEKYLLLKLFSTVDFQQSVLKKQYAQASRSACPIAALKARR